MKENVAEKGLVVVNKNSILYRIQYFISKIIHRKNHQNLTLIANGKSTIIIPKEINIKATIIKEDAEDYFMKCVKSIEDNGVKLLELQEKYAAGQVEKGLSVDQIDTLCDLYDKQIINLKKFKELNV